MTVERRRKMQQRILMSLCILAGILIILAVITYRKLGVGGLKNGITNAAGLFAGVFPVLLLGICIAGFFQVLVPKELVADIMGRQAGIRGILLGGVAGAIIPGGPYIQFPLAFALFEKGASIGAICAYICAWGLFGVQRFIVWEMPVLGYRIALTRVISCILFPIVIGIIAQFLYDRLARFV
jgi:uncharacterized membrane protein YraQ (UPF0718 family)